nr:WYL domain-containing protein [Pectobacterium sp. PL152]
MKKDYFLPPLNFDPDELDAIMLGMRLISARGDNMLSAAASRVSAKISAAIGAKKQIPISRFLSERFLGIPRKMRGPSTIWLFFVWPFVTGSNCILPMLICKEESDRVARPLGLTLFDAVWLLTIWCETRSDFRNLRVDNITSLAETGLYFRPEKGKRFEDYLNTL